MARLALLALAVLAGVALRGSAACPDYAANSGCNTGSCAAGGLSGTFAVPADLAGLLKLYGGSLSFSGSIALSGSGGEKVKLAARGSAAQCCAACKAASACRFWQWLDLKQYGSTGGACFTYLGSTGPRCAGGDGGGPSSHVGGKCVATVNDDPHLVGGHGTHYDFAGAPGKSFCLLSDAALHLNMELAGYLDARTESAAVLRGGRAVRTWIRRLGLLWRAGGAEHRLLLAARGGNRTARGEGFLERAELGGYALPRLQVGESLTLEGGLTMALEAVEERGALEVDVYRVRVADLLDLAVRVRVATPLLRTREDAMAHLSLGLNAVKTTAAVHGVLGQTYREGREERSKDLADVAALLGRHVAADSDEGKGFLDGDVTTDYVTSDVMSADCHFSKYGPIPSVE